PCVPVTCSEIGATCGPLMDGCGHTLNCGKCPKDFECKEQRCVCKPDKSCNSGPGGGETEPSSAPSP
ncbi:MAG TPA: hypothetical protein VHO25_08495, partial [Polyangiaceae bacterium]|nr:hypothetical protein [Polyangiaceae bacterium]